MKKRRRIEITTFRSRTTITVRDPGHLEPPRDSDTSVEASANLPQADGDLKPPQVVQSLLAGLAQSGLRDEHQLKENSNEHASFK